MMPIELRHLRYVIAADKHRSFRQAATALRLKQSTLSRRIHQLEDELGVLLFTRHSGGVRPTTAGHDFLRRAKRITEEVHAMTVLAKAESRGEVGRLSIGFYTSLSAGNLRASLLDYVTRYPEVICHAVEGVARPSVRRTGERRTRHCNRQRRSRNLRSRNSSSALGRTNHGGVTGATSACRPMRSFIGPTSKANGFC